MTIIRIVAALLGTAALVGLLLVVMALAGVIGDPMVWQR
jgi:hypothetical protein